MTAWVGLTGGIGSGKSKAAACFALLGVPVIDADAVSRTLTQTPDSEALRQIRQTFGDAVIDSAGCLNRAAMREYVFADEQARQRLETILHPLIYREIERQKAACTPYHHLFTKIIPLQNKTIGIFGPYLCNFTFALMNING